MEDLRLKLELELDEARAQIRGLREDIESVGTELSKAKIGLDTSEAKKQIEDLRGSLTSTKTEIDGVFNKFRDLPNAPVANKAGGNALTGINARLKELQANIAKVTGETRQGISIDNESREQIEAKVAALNNYRSALTNIRPEIESGTSTQLALENAIRNSTETIARFNGELNRRDASEALKQQRIEAEQFKNEFNQLEATFKKVANEQRSLIATNNLNAESQEKLAQSYREIAQAQAQLAQANENDASRIKRLEVLTTSRITAEKKLSDEIKKQIAANSQADASAENRAQAEARLRAELDRVRIEIRDLDLERKKALTTETLTEEALEGTISRYNQLEQRLKSLRTEFASSSRGTRQISTTQSQLFNATQRARNGFTSLSGAMADNTKLNSQANQTIIEFSRGLSDSQQFMFGLQSGFIAIGNNISQTTEVGTRFIKTAGGLGNAFKLLAANLTGVGGLILAVNAATVVLPILARAFKKNKDDVDEASQALQDYKSILDKVRGSSSADFLGLQARSAELKDSQDLLSTLERINEVLIERNAARQLGARFAQAEGAFINAQMKLREEVELSNKELAILRQRYGDLSKITIDEVKKDIDDITTSINKQVISLREFSNVGEAYQIVQKLVEDFESTVDSSGRQVTTARSQFEALRAVSQGFIDTFSSDGSLDTSERAFLSWLDRIVDGTKKRIGDLEIEIENPITEIFDSIINDSELSIPSIIKTLENDFKIDIKTQDALINVEILKGNLIEASKLIEERYTDELLFIELTKTSAEQAELDKTKAYEKYLKAKEKLTKQDARSTEQVYRNTLNNVRVITDEQALFGANSYEQASKRIKDSEALNTFRLNFELANRQISYEEFQERLRQIEVDSAQQQQAIQRAKYDSFNSIAENSISFISDITEALGGTSEKNARRQFNIQKALGVSQATIDAYLAISRVFADGSPVPTAARIPLAASIGAAAFARVAKIASTKFGQSGSNSEASASASSFSEGFSFSDIQPSSPVVNVEADSFVDVLRNSQSNQSIVIENRVSNKEFYTLVKSGEGEVLASSQSASRDRFA